MNGASGGTLHRLDGFGVELVRERELASAVQCALERLYQIERVADVKEYVSRAEDGEREALLVHEADDGALEMSVRIAPLARARFNVANDRDLDPLCQLIEGVSHFVYLTSRHSEGRSATHLELELQAEVDKYIVIVASLGSLDAHAGSALRARLYELVSFTNDEGTELGDRYRVANTHAGRFVRHLEQRFILEKRYEELRHELRAFFRLGQEGKLRTTIAA